jgi:asparagine synthetase B (glutamine-hydrolysing)
MCGIHLSAWNNPCCSRCQQFQQQQEDGSTLSTANLRRRGPDSCNAISFTLPATQDDDSSSVQVSLQASVLQMRQDLVEQPVSLEIPSDQEQSSDASYYLCWNGEVYQATDDDTAGTYETSDTRLVKDRLSQALARVSTKDPLTIAPQIASVLGGLYNAEFAFLIVRSDGEIFYGRDPWGRRSLLRWDCSHCGSFHIASTAPSMIVGEGSEVSSQNSPSKELAEWQEIPPGMVHVTSSRRATVESIPISTLDRSSISTPKLPDLAPHTGTTAPPEGVSVEFWKAAHEMEFHLSQAVQRRMDHHSSTAVLFSGGLDSAVVAALAARHCTHPLHLYNVSFGPTFEKSADRQAALITHQALQAQYPDKTITFQDIVVTWEDICEHELHVRTLLQPKETLMDVNIATALWFASRGGTKRNEANEERPRVLLLGMGADELLGGYGRHRKSFERGGWEELQQELQMDQSRFWERNLGRDDRIVADHGREARFPFLDFHVTEFLQTLPLSSICDFSLPPGQGDKRVLRLVAMRLGLDHASGLVKRAIQFGSRISHLSDAKRFGSRRKAKGEAAVKTPG